MPCAAAFDFARWKTRSGISRVVFIDSMFPYLWDKSEKLTKGFLSNPVTRLPCSDVPQSDRSLMDVKKPGAKKAPGKLFLVEVVVRK